jgi:glycerol-3-phosphate dehydrogenase
MSPERDVLVVGGGVQGAGVLQAAAAAGHAALLLEARELASGTSSKSSKLIHGGLRYLETLQLGLVRESLREREILLGIAPHLVQLVPFLIPIYRATTRRPWQIRAGLSLYALLGGLGRHARFERLPESDWGDLDGLSTVDLERVYRYRDGQTDDARLVRAVVASARELGAEAAEGASLVAAERCQQGWRVRYERGGREEHVTARVVVNAAGPWINLVAERFRPAPPAREVALVGGAHIELPGALEHGIYYTEAADRRAVFIMPWKGRTLVGTTEREHRGDPRDARASAEEIEYLRATLARYFPGRSTEVLGAWAGLRVLPTGGTRAFDRPREVTLVADDQARPSYLAVYGGKLTGYRATAAKVQQRIAPSLPSRPARADTAGLRLPEVP